jgi:hypothetical protein
MILALMGLNLAKDDDEEDSDMTLNRCQATVSELGSHRWLQNGPPIPNQCSVLR